MERTRSAVLPPALTPENAKGGVLRTPAGFSLDPAGQELAQRCFCNETDPVSNGIGSNIRATPASQERSKSKNSTAPEIREP
jgi:hypothetical protein